MAWHRVAVAWRGALYEVRSVKHGLLLSPLNARRADSSATLRKADVIKGARVAWRDVAGHGAAGRARSLHRCARITARTGNAPPNFGRGAPQAWPAHNDEVKRGELYGLNFSGC